MTTRGTNISGQGTPERVKQVMNDLLIKTTGYQFTRAEPWRTGRNVPRAASGKPRPGGARYRKRVDRLVPKPVFLLSPVRSGSTLMRVILDSHSQICAPHELHLHFLRVNAEKNDPLLAMTQLGLDQRKLEHLLWDRILERELTASGKRIIVDKTPSNVFVWEELQEAWPEARYIFLVRHPQAIADSLSRARRATVDEVASSVASYGNALDVARQNLAGPTVRYEDLVTEPAKVAQLLCEHLGVRFELSMLDYGAADHGPFIPRIGDWSPKIRSGAIDSDLVLPRDEDVHPLLQDLSRSWGYLD